jgi:WD40 repeat protein
MWLVSAKETRELAHATSIATVGNGQIATIETDRVVLRDVIGTSTTTYDVGNARALAMSNDGKRIAFGLINSVIELFDAETHTSLGFLVGHHGPIKEVAFSPDDTLLVSLSDDS